MKAGVLLGKMLLHLISLYSYSHTNANKNPTNTIHCEENDLYCSNTVFVGLFNGITCAG